jgi:hypothetical protein
VDRRSIDACWRSALRAEFCNLWPICTCGREVYLFHPSIIRLFQAHFTDRSVFAEFGSVLPLRFAPTAIKVRNRSFQVFRQIAQVLGDDIVAR